jgi:transcriptional regulator with XRE-family HTH domain
MRTVREGLGVTQVEVAEALGTDQAEISRFERRPDVMLSTARKYAAALGARAELAFVFEDGSRVVIAEPDEPLK